MIYKKVVVRGTLREYVWHRKHEPHIRRDDAAARSKQGRRLLTVGHVAHSKEPSLLLHRPRICGKEKVEMSVVIRRCKCAHSLAVQTKPRHNNAVHRRAVVCQRTRHLILAILCAQLLIERI